MAESLYMLLKRKREDDDLGSESPTKKSRQGEESVSPWTLLSKDDRYYIFKYLGTSGARTLCAYVTQ